MSTESIKTAVQPEPAQDAITAVRQPVEQLQTNVQGLAKFGGFDLLESAIDDVQNINPDRKARKKIFLEEHSKKEERASLKNLTTLAGCVAKH